MLIANFQKVDISFPDKRKMPIGDYNFFVNNFALRGRQKGFAAEIEFDGQIFNFEYDQPMKDKENVMVATVYFDGENFSIKKSLPSNHSSKRCMKH